MKSPSGSEASAKSARDDRNQLKVQGLAFGRSLQMVLKTVIMYSVDHPAVEKVLQQTYAALQNLARQTQQFTFGFVNQRVLVGNILTDDSTLRQLELEFSKRGIAAVAFSEAVTLRDFKRVLALLSTKPQVLDENAGIKTLFDQNPIEGVRIVPARKRGREQDDTVLGMGSEPYRVAQEILGPSPGAGLAGLDLLCQSAGLEKPAGFGGSAGEVLALAGKAIQTALTDPRGDPRGLLAALARWFEELSPEYVLRSLPAAKQNALHGLAAGEVATDLVEDVAANWGVKRITATPAGADAAAAEEEVVRLLFRGLQATRLAERLLHKLARLLEEAGLPPEVYDRLRQGVIWYSLSHQEQHERLLALQRYSAQEFQRLVTYVKETLDQGRIPELFQLADHYFTAMNSAPVEIKTAELARAPELLRAMASLETLEFLRRVTERMCGELLDDPHTEIECHRELVNCLACMAQIVSPFEDFELIHRIGSNLERSLVGHGAQHSSCCGMALGRLVSPASAERLVELFLTKREDPAGTKTITSLLKWLGPLGGERIFQRLEEETAAPNRMRLMRLLAQFGAGGIEPARKRLADPRWYVVRNACRILGDLGDPALSTQLRGALRHADARVQQAAVTAIIRSQVPDRAQVLAESLPYLRGQGLELALDELTLLKDPASIEGLELLILGREDVKTVTLEKALRALAVLPAERAAEALGKVLSCPELAPALRKTALEALSRSPFALGQRLHAEFTSRLASAPPPAESKVS